jgi:hypothetical protein
VRVELGRAMLGRGQGKGGEFHSRDPIRIHFLFIFYSLFKFKLMF